MKQSILAVALSATVFVSGVAMAQAGTGPAHPRGMMARPDANGDGVLTREEFLAQADKRFDRLDFNHDGKVSEETLVAAHEGRGVRGHGMGGRGGMRGRGMGGRGMDRGGPDGMMSPPPPPGAQNTPPTPETRMAAMRVKADERFRAIDTNRDGSLDRTEFRAEALQHFNTLDANHDGRIDAAEREAMRMEMRGKMHDRMRGDMPPPPPPAK